MFKRFVGLVTAIVISVACACSCYAIEFDGIPNNSEWMESTVYSFENPDGFNNGVTFAYMRVIPRVESNQLYFCFSMRVDDISGAENSAVLISLNDGEEICLQGTCNSPYNENLYNIEYAMAYDTGSSNIVYEVMLGVKHGIPASSKVTVRLCDCKGIPSNEFGFDLDTIISNQEEEERENNESTQLSKTEKTSSSTKKQSNRKPSVTTGKSNKYKTNNNGNDNFNFNKVEINPDKTNASQSAEDETTATVNLTEQITDNSSVKNKVLTAVGVICAVAIAGGAVYSGIKKSNKKEDKE